MHEYSISGDNSKNSAQCIDLGVTKTDDFHCNSHIIFTCLKASRLHGMGHGCLNCVSKKSWHSCQNIFSLYTPCL